MNGRTVPEIDREPEEAVSAEGAAGGDTRQGQRADRIRRRGKVTRSTSIRREGNGGRTQTHARGDRGRRQRSDAPKSRRTGPRLHRSIEGQTQGSAESEPKSAATGLTGIQKARRTTVLYALKPQDDVQEDHEGCDGRAHGGSTPLVHPGTAAQDGEDLHGSTAAPYTYEESTCRAAGRARPRRRRTPRTRSCRRSPCISHKIFFLLVYIQMQVRVNRRRSRGRTQVRRPRAQRWPAAHAVHKDGFIEVYMTKREVSETPRPKHGVKQCMHNKSTGVLGHQGQRPATCSSKGDAVQGDEFFFYDGRAPCYGARLVRDAVLSIISTRPSMPLVRSWAMSTYCTP
ncbi:uncharacterized protein LOC104582594 [Brachypodium distachyon]|uniref:Uncharacterized protein n=1 Tax=Brachypodium distachyon TaxID=15368 RepID=A0A0Q3G052_BRADI|nr:uncharacterized protein LOC104582594 [Brachypodium distachyon]KQK04936.1 hypothetical protein BRADI_2g16893v3 [Brachypodium distachyon]|eukprot:XP_014754342.1 uncharacterized protein LOC104582594 [Brachypodium distachyon]